jgi:hypothetical protein
MFIMRYGTFILALGALWSSQASAGEVQSVYVAPGGVYIASAQVYVRPENADPAYAAPGRTYYAPGHVPLGSAYTPGYVPPGQVYGAPTFYESTRSIYPVYPAQRAYVDRQAEYSSTYDTEFVPRPPAPVPYGGRERCVTNPAYGPSAYCD